MVDLYNRILQSYETEQTTATLHNVDNKWKKQDERKGQLWFHLYRVAKQTTLNYMDVSGAYGTRLSGKMKSKETNT